MRNLPPPRRLIELLAILLLFFLYFFRNARHWEESPHFLTHSLNAYDPTRNQPNQPKSDLFGQLPGGRKRPEPFCQKLIADPHALTPECDLNVSTKLCHNGKPTFFSKTGQDLYLYQNHFRHLKRPGVYVDIAANDPVRISNTYFFDACLGWRGVCVEANPTYFSRLSSERSCSLVPTCATDEDGKVVRMRLHGVLSGVEETQKNVELFKQRKYRGTVIQMTCLAMRSVLRKLDVVEIDYMSLDVEGHELFVLMGLDFSRSRVKVMTVEKMGPMYREVTEFLRKNRYVEHMPENRKDMREDAVFLLPDVQFGKPV